MCYHRNRRDQRWNVSVVSLIIISTVSTDAVGKLAVHNALSAESTINNSVVSPIVCCSWVTGTVIKEVSIYTVSPLDHGVLAVELHVKAARSSCQSAAGCAIQDSSTRHHTSAAGLVINMTPRLPTVRSNTIIITALRIQILGTPLVLTIAGLSHLCAFGQISLVASTEPCHYSCGRRLLMFAAALHHS